VFDSALRGVFRVNLDGGCRYVLEMLGQVNGCDAEARARDLSPGDRLRLHQERKGPVMEQMHVWLEAQLAEHKTEPTASCFLAKKSIPYVREGTRWTRYCRGRLLFAAKLLEGHREANTGAERSCDTRAQNDTRLHVFERELQSFNRTRVRSGDFLQHQYQTFTQIVA
jgi:hypothetical protein